MNFQKDSIDSINQFKGKIPIRRDSVESLEPPKNNDFMSSQLRLLNEKRSRGIQKNTIER